MKNPSLLIKLILPVVLVLSCGSAQIPEPLLPTWDAGTAPTFDHDAYVVNIPDPVPLRLTPDPDAGIPAGQIAPVHQGARVPFNGVVFDGPALAYLETQVQGVQQQCTIDRRADLQRLAARATADLGILTNAFNAREQEFEVLLQGRDREVQRLYELANHPHSFTDYLLWGGGGTLVGAGVLGAFYMLLH